MISAAQYPVNAMKPTLSISLGGLAALIMMAIAADHAAAMTAERAREQCREKFTPIVQACVRKRVMESQGSPSEYLAGCRAGIASQFKACMTALLMPGASGFRPSVLDTAKSPAPRAAKAVASANRAAPPRTIADITAILDQEKPDPSRLAKLKAAADASPPANADAVALAHFHSNRGNIRAELGRLNDAIADGERAVALAEGKVAPAVVSTFRNFVALQYIFAGELRKAKDAFLKMVEEGERSGQGGYLFNAHRHLAVIELQMGNFARAQDHVDALEALWKRARSTRGYQYNASTWESNVVEARARLLEARGELEESLNLYVRAEALRRRGMDENQGSFIVIPRAILEQAADFFLLNVARMKARVGRLAEAEADARRALLSRLRATGKYAPQTARYIAALGALLVEQGRLAEAKKLIAATIDIYLELGVPEDSQTFVGVLGGLASVQALAGEWAEAGQTYAAMERATEQWEPRRRARFLINFGRIETLYKTARIEQGLAAGRRLLEFRVTHYGDQHPETAIARGHYAVGLARAKRDAEALKEFEASVPLLTSTTFNTDSEDVLNAAARTRYTQVIVENYIDLLARQKLTAGKDVASEAFRLADSIRSRSVQKALTAAGARMTASDAKLAAVVRSEQDMRQQIGSQLGQLNVLLALPASQRDDAGVVDLRKRIEKLHIEHARVRADIDRRFPEYADLIDPKPPTAAQIGEMLRPGEAMLSFYFGREASFVWAIAYDGKVAFAALPDSAEAIEAKIKKLREALEPQAAMISEIPAFDLALSHELYKTLLEPVKAGWAHARSLIVVTNGALGLLPLGVLTVAPHRLSEDGPMFSGYRSAPWLSRTHAVTVVPSAAALRTLRRLPPGSTKRDKLIAFGDPFFSDKHAAEAGEPGFQLAAAVQTRAIPLKRRAAPQVEGVDSVELAQLPRLPDTADELRSIALALEADPSKVLHLGKDANELTVKKAKLHGFRIVAFATHGLVPGEIDGLTQPALALSAPSVAGVEGDGLLTMEEILSLKLDADWVVLSACNTGAAAGAGAEAASGLGRAFFYAGTRAVLVTNWSVHSQSARELVTDLFRRQANDPKLTRGEALRQAMMALLDGKGFTDDVGKTLFSYSHPLFWAPYTIIGDGG
jgi:CHAT domain-containing protein